MSTNWQKFCDSFCCGLFNCTSLQKYQSECAQDFEDVKDEKRTTTITREPEGNTKMDDFKSFLDENEKHIPVSNPNTVEPTHTAHFQREHLPTPLITGDKNNVTLVSQSNPKTHPEPIKQNIQDSPAVIPNCTRNPGSNKCIKPTVGEDEITGLETVNSYINTKATNRRNSRRHDDNEHANLDDGGPGTLPHILGFSSGHVQADNLANSVIHGDSNTVSINTPQTTSSTRNELNSQGLDSVTIAESEPAWSRAVEQDITKKVPPVTKTRNETETTNKKRGLSKNTSLEDVGYVSTKNGSLMPSKTNSLETVSKGHFQTEISMNAVPSGKNNGLNSNSPRNSPASLGNHQEFNNQTGTGSLGGRGFSDASVLVSIRFAGILFHSWAKSRQVMTRS